MRKKGDAYEQKACQYLQNTGYTVLCQNYHSRYGEIDIIATKDDTLVFFEVRARKISRYGTAGDTITLQKRQKIIKTATDFLGKHDAYQNFAARFDVILFDITKNSHQDRMEHIVGAFWA